MKNYLLPVTVLVVLIFGFISISDASFLHGAAQQDSLFISPSQSGVCSYGDSVQLIINVVPIDTINCAPSPNSCLNSGFTAELQLAGAIVTPTTNSFPAPFGNAAKTSKQQYLYLESELIAMGFTAGRITEIGFNVTQLNGASVYHNYTIKLRCTGQHSIPTLFFEYGCTQVMYKDSITLTTGWNMLHFDQPYMWDGMSDLLVELCFDNRVQGATFNSICKTREQLTPSFKSAAMDTSDVNDACASVFSDNTYFTRPDTRFTLCNETNTDDFQYSWTPNYNISDTSVFNPSVWPDSAMTYQVIVSDSLGVNVDTLWYTTTLDANLDMSFTHQSAYCIGSPITTFIPVLSGGVFTGAGIDSTGNFNADSAGVGTWAINYRGTSANGCVYDSNINISVLDLPSISILASKQSICDNSDSVQLVLQANPDDTISCSLSSSPCLNAGFTAEVQLTGTLITPTTTSYPAPFGNFVKSAKQQYLYYASELIAMGLTAGSMNEIGFYVTQINGTSTYHNYRVKMGCTPNTSMPGTIFPTGLSQVLHMDSIIITTGWNMLTFDQAYVWDGISNIIVELCFDNRVQGATFNSICRTRENFGAGQFLASLSLPIDTADACDGQLAVMAQFSRPDTRFTMCNAFSNTHYQYNWSPNLNMNDTTAVDPWIWADSTTNYQVIITDSLGVCADTLSYQVVVNHPFDAGFTHKSPYCFTSDQEYLAPFDTGGVFTGAGIDGTGKFLPDSAGMGTWPINYTVSTPEGCMSDSTMLITVLPFQDASFVGDEICQFADSLLLQPVVTGGMWSGLGIGNANLGSFNPVGLNPGMYAVMYTLSSPCYNVDTQFVKVTSALAFVFPKPNVDACIGDSTDISYYIPISTGAFPTTGPVQETWSDLNGYVDSNGVFDATLTPLGTYTVSLTIEPLDSACAASQSLNVTVRGLDYPELLTSTYCENETDAKIYVTPWLFGIGSGFSQKPLYPLGPSDTLTVSAFGQNGEFNPNIRGAGSWEMTFGYINNYGCLGITIDTIQVYPTPDTSVVNVGSSLQANADSTHQFQWFDCNNNMAMIPGATQATFSPEIVGIYAVEVRSEYCTVVSACIQSNPTGVKNTELKMGVSIYPNPVAEQLYIDLDKNKNVTIEILDAKGKIVWIEKSKDKISTIDMSHLAAGMYMVKLITDSGVQTRRVLKK